MADLPHASSIDIPTESSVVSRESSSEDSSHSIKRDVGDMPRGFIFTTAADKRDLEIYFIHAPLKKLFDAEIRVLEKFAAIWARGELVSHQNDREIAISIIILTDDYYQSPEEQSHITIAIADKSTWAAGAGYAMGCVHIYYKNDAKLDYPEIAWLKSSASKERFQGKIVKRHLRKAMRNNLESYRDAQKPSETKVRCDDGGKPSSEA
ncbi:hypothetical protein E4U44_000218 [Claviceps purpurea]|nr:hypothetical protein E4U44_000218 [Claviceps purpurea]